MTSKPLRRGSGTGGVAEHFSLAFPKYLKHTDLVEDVVDEASHDPSTAVASPAQVARRSIRSYDVAISSSRSKGE